MIVTYTAANPISGYVPGDRRLAICDVSYAYLAGILFRSGPICQTVTVAAIPPDVVVISATDIPELGAMRLVLWHPTFDPVGEGMVIPRREPVFSVRTGCA